MNNCILSFNDAFSTAHNHRELKKLRIDFDKHFRIKCLTIKFADFVSAFPERKRVVKICNRLPRSVSIAFLSLVRVRIRIDLIS